MVRLLSEIEPLLRAHIRRRRTQRGPMLATSDIFASVVRRAVMDPSEAAQFADSSRQSSQHCDPDIQLGSVQIGRRISPQDPREGRESAAARAAARAADTPDQTDQTAQTASGRKGAAISFVLTLADRALALARRKERRERTTAAAAARRGVVVKSEIDATTSDAISKVERADVLRNLLKQADDMDRVIMRLRVSGAQWRVIAAETSTTETACRQRWSRLLKRLAIQLSDD
jgi:hypothetical protein